MIFYGFREIAEFGSIFILNPSINYHYKQKTQNSLWLAIKTA
jgi:hypothetical protein